MIERSETYPIAPGEPGWRQQKRRAVWTGEFRAPSCGEWFLSGASPEAYQAIADLGTKYHIARLVDPSPDPLTPAQRAAVESIRSRCVELDALDADPSTYVDAVFRLLSILDAIAPREGVE
jgi:hypothetical protein